jgi:hypothetical protein
MIINDIKMLILGTNMTLTKVAKKLGEKLNKNYTVTNLSKKLRGETISHKEIKMIADILGYDVKFVKRT